MSQNATWRLKTRASSSSVRETETISQSRGLVLMTWKECLYFARSDAQLPSQVSIRAMPPFCASVQEKKKFFFGVFIPILNDVLHRFQRTTSDKLLPHQTTPTPSPFPHTLHDGPSTPHAKRSRILPSNDPPELIKYEPKSKQTELSVDASQPCPSSKHNLARRPLV